MDLEVSLRDGEMKKLLPNTAPTEIILKVPKKKKA